MKAKPKVYGVFSLIKIIGRELSEIHNPLQFFQLMPLFKMVINNAVS